MLEKKSTHNIQFTMPDTQQKINRHSKFKEVGKYDRKLKGGDINKNKYVNETDDTINR